MILIFGNDLSGPNAVKTQGQILRDHLVKYGFKVKMYSSKNQIVWRVIDMLMGALRSRSDDVVILQVYSSLFLYILFCCAFIAHRRGARLIATLHGGNLPQVYNNHPIKRRMIGYLLTTCDVTAPSRYIPESIGLRTDQYSLLHNIIDLPNTNFGNNNKQGIHILWMRAYHETYNPVLAVNVFKAVRNQIPDATMIMAGPDLGLRNETERAAIAAGISDGITFRGKLSPNELSVIARDITCYLCTNLIDNAPVTFLEMMALQLPIVTTGNGGIPKYVQHDVTARISNQDDPNQLADLLIELHYNSSLSRHLISQGLLFIKEYQAESVIPQWVNLINQSNNPIMKQ